VQFDLTGLGQTAQVGWASAQDGLLVRDLNGDGIINDGRELFGAATELANGQRAGDGYRAMGAGQRRRWQAECAGRQAWASCSLWVDANSDGKTDAGELFGLMDFGIVVDQPGLHPWAASMNNGNLLGWSAATPRPTAARAEMADVWFAKQGDPPPSLDDVLAPAPGALLGEAAAPTAPAATAAAPMGVAGMGRSSLEDELLRNGPLI
jgi:trimeric autotransporter adhesin